MPKPTHTPTDKDVAEAVGNALRAFSEKYEALGHGKLPVQFFASNEAMQSAINQYIDDLADPLCC